MDLKQLETLKAMTEQQAVKHYWNLFRNNSITREQYDKGIEYWKKLNRENTGNRELQGRPSESAGLCDSPPEGYGKTLIEAFGGYEVEEPEAQKGISQKLRILELLKDYQPHKVSEIRDKVYGVNGQGNACIHSRITELRGEGHDIPPASGTGTDRVYKLNNPNKLA
jgi:hypothetical protein